MKSLNSPARKDIIKFPTVKFALSPLVSLFVLALFLSLPVLAVCPVPRCSHGRARPLIRGRPIIKSDK